MLKSPMKINSNTRNSTQTHQTTSKKIYQSLQNSSIPAAINQIKSTIWIKIEGIKRIGIKIEGIKRIKIEGIKRIKIEGIKRIWFFVKRSCWKSGVDSSENKGWSLIGMKKPQRISK